MERHDSLVSDLRACLPEYMAQRGCVVGSTGRRKIRCINPAHADRSPSMSYDPRTKRLHCFGCGESYDLFDVIAMDYPECGTFPQQVRKACELFGRDYPEGFSRMSHSGQRLSVKKAAPYQDGEEAGAQDYTAYIDGLLGQVGAGGAYFERRGISRALCEAYNLFEYGGRAYMPIYQGGRCVAYCARSIAEDLQPRYKNSPGQSAVFGGDLLGIPGNGAGLVVTESILDALSAEECGFRAVALCGAGNVQRFLRLCAQAPAAAGAYRFLAAGDNDEAGRRMNDALCGGLSAMGFSCARVALPGGAKDLNDALLRDRAALRMALDAALDAGGDGYMRQTASAALDALFDAGNQAGLRTAVPTGFRALDGILDGGLYSGLYILGAVSSLGKTSLALQIADSIAGQGRDVLFFSLEMGRMELAAKSLSRYTWLLDASAGHTDALPFRDTVRLAQGLAPHRAALLRDAAAAYRKAADRLYLFEGVASIGTAEIRESIRRHVALRGNVPVVIVDYLQILKPASRRATDKQNTDKAVVELKRISRDFDLPLLAISSFNRDNYRNAVSMEAFKESGAVEYSSDVLLGLQLEGTGQPGFDADEAKRRMPRRLELIILKNRGGMPYARIPFEYHAKFSLFKEGKI